MTEQKTEQKLDLTDFQNKKYLVLVKDKRYSARIICINRNYHNTPTIVALAKWPNTETEFLCCFDNSGCGILDSDHTSQIINATEQSCTYSAVYDRVVGCSYETLGQAIKTAFPECTGILKITRENGKPVASEILDI